MQIPSICPGPVGGGEGGQGAAGIDDALPSAGSFKLIEFGTDINTYKLVLSRLYFLVIQIQIILQICNLARPIVTLWPESLNSRCNSAEHVLMKKTSLL